MKHDKLINEKLLLDLVDFLTTIKNEQNHYYGDIEYFNKSIDLLEKLNNKG